MGKLFTQQDGQALFGMLADNSDDVILKTDCHGFILCASSAISQVGFPEGGELFGRHITDIVHPRYATVIRQRHAHAVAGQIDRSWCEFTILTPDGNEHWFEIRMRGVTDSNANGDDVAGQRAPISNVISVMRCIDDKKSFERQLFVATMTDQLTGLTNRKAFLSMLDHLVQDDTAGCLVIFDIDHFKAINLRFGPSVGDTVLIAFAEFVRSSVRDTDIISRIAGESIGVILTGVDTAQADAICSRIVADIAEISRGHGAGNIPVTASAGVARIATSADDTLRRAELALTLAKAKGRNRLETEGHR